MDILGYMLTGGAVYVLWLWRQSIRETRRNRKWARGVIEAEEAARQRRDQDWRR